MIGKLLPGKSIHQALRIDRAIRLVWGSAPGWTFLNILLVTVQGLLPLVGLYLMKLIIDSVTTGLSSPDETAAFHQVFYWIILAAGVALITALCRSLGELTGETQSQILTDSVSDLLHAQSITIDLEYYEDPRFYDTLHRAQQEAPYRPNQIVQGLIQIGQNGLSLLGIITLLFSFNYLLAFLLVCAALPTGLVRLIYARRSFSLEQGFTEKERKAWYYHFLMTDPGPAQEVRVFNLGPFFQDRYRDLRRLLREGRLAFKGKRSWMDFLAQTLATCAIFGSLAYITMQTLKKTISLGSLVIYYQGFQLGLSSFQAVLRGLAGLYEDNLFLNNFYQFLDLKPQIQSSSRSKSLPSPIREIVFQGVHFSYPSKEQEVLDDIHLTIHPGGVIALVGENGSGKTTLIKLLCRLYDPTSGKITVNGIDIRDFDPITWRSHISVLFQDYVHYYLSARENIGLGDVEKSSGSGPIVEAAKLSGADPLIRRLPQGYDTILGPRFEGGQELSIGEWQKIATARAILRKSDIMVLDEPTSSLDSLAEAELFQRFRQMIQGRTAILISHRFSTVQLADRIYVLDQSRIIEEGSHRELLEQNGKYANLYRTQAERYQ
jgi:ATP-binding cassette, subfamily B, bacterial